MNRRRWRQRRNHDVAELNITAFMNLMVILVPFLLITAVFSRVTILEVSLPAPSDTAADIDKPVLQLEVTIRDSGIEVGDANTGMLKELPLIDGAKGHDLAALSDYLQQVKAQFPDKTDVSILLEPGIDYDTMVQVMDTVRVFVPDNGAAQYAELFPDISIGDATAKTLTSAVIPATSKERQ